MADQIPDPNCTPGSLVKVEWLDSQDHKDNWVAEADAETFADVECKIVSYGIVVRKTAKYLTIAGDWDASDRDYGRVTKVPVGMLVSITRLREEPGD